MATKKPRLSLTKAQIEAGAGAELLALCQSVTEDGSISTQEIAELRKWLIANRESGLPAIGFLTETVTRIIADGKVTKDERNELYKAIEAVLPPEARRDATLQRKVVESEEKARIREERDAIKQKEREQRDAIRQQQQEERERTRPVYRMNFMVAGVHYEGRPEIIKEYVQDGDDVFLARDPQNKFSRNAIEVRLRNGMQIGFVPEDDAVNAAEYLDQGFPHTAHITKILTGGRTPIPVVQAYVYRPDANIEGQVFPSDVPTKQDVPRNHSATGSRQSGCLSVVLLFIAPALLGATWLVRLL